MYRSVTATTLSAYPHLTIIILNKIVSLGEIILQFNLNTARLTIFYLLSALGAGGGSIYNIPIVFKRGHGFDLSVTANGTVKRDLSAR